MKNKLQSESLVKPVLQDIRRKILTWEFPPHFQLIEERLCQTYNVSRSPIRQALTHLEAEGLVEKRPRIGFFVKQVLLHDIEELYELRFALEWQVVKGLVNKELPEKTHQKLFNCWSKTDIEQNLSAEQLALLDEEFHTELAKAHGNKMILNQIRLINERIFVFREIDFRQEGRLADTQKEHLEILRRIIAKDLEYLEKILQKNIFSGLGNVKTAVIQLIAKSYIG
ncbi:MAG TPA: hypothetical protein DD638_06175 [Pasteurellaceae bacterium]|nr:hypothetical protein [Pasteurellaceae bacterium]